MSWLAVFEVAGKDNKSEFSNLLTNVFHINESGESRKTLVEHKVLVKHSYSMKYLEAHR